MTPGPRFLLDRAFRRFIPDGSAGLDRQLRLYLAFVFVLFTPTTLGLAWIDWRRGEHLTAALVSVIALILLSSLWVLRRARDIRWGYRFVLGTAVVLLNGVIYVGGGGGYAVLWSYAFPAGFHYVFGAREGTVWGFALLVPAATILLSDVGAAYPPALAGRYVLTYALMMALSLGLQWTRESAFQALQDEKTRLESALAQVRTLKEMIPMCAWCRKVRDDDGYWSRIEEYLGRQVGSTVSHGLCPECSVKLEAEFDGGGVPGPDSGEDLR